MTYILTETTSDGRTVYWDGHGFTLLRECAKQMSFPEAQSRRTSLCHEFPDCKLERV